MANHEQVKWLLSLTTKLEGDLLYKNRQPKNKYYYDPIKQKLARVVWYAKDLTLFLAEVIKGRITNLPNLLLY